MRWTLYIQSSDAITTTIALSPDGGENFVPMAEGPIVFNAPSRTIIECGMDATHIALVGSNPAPINAWVRGIF